VQSVEEFGGGGPAVRSDAQGHFSFHEHPRQLSGAAGIACREIRNMHSTYGYYGLYL
jgi:hypothetical protein